MVDIYKGIFLYKANSKEALAKEVIESLVLNIAIATPPFSPNWLTSIFSSLPVLLSTTVKYTVELP